MSETPRSPPNASSLWKALRSMKRSVEPRPTATATVVGCDVGYGRGAPQAVEQRLGLRRGTVVVIGQRPPRGRDRLATHPVGPPARRRRILERDLEVLGDLVLGPAERAGHQRVGDPPARAERERPHDVADVAVV